MATSRIRDGQLDLGDCLTDDLPPLADEQCVEDEDDWQDPREVARATPAGRRLRALRRMLLEAPTVPVAEALRRCMAAGDDRHAPGDHLRLVACATIGGAIIAGHVDCVHQDGVPVVCRGPRFDPVPDRRDIVLGDDDVSLLVGAWTIVGDPLPLWQRPPDEVSLLVLPVRVLERIVVDGRLELESLVGPLLDDLRRHDPALARRLGPPWVRQQLRAVLVLLAEFGWVECGRVDAKRLPAARITHLGILGALMIMTVIHGELPPELDEEARDQGYLRARDGYIHPDDVPFSVHVN